MLLVFFVYTLEHTQGLKTASDIPTTMVSPMLESKFFGTSNKTKTHYLQTGDSNGQLIICLHGLGGSVSTFKPLVPSLPKKYNIVLMDFQGFGQTPLTSNTEPLSFSGHVYTILSHFYREITMAMRREERYASRSAAVERLL